MKKKSTTKDIFPLPLTPFQRLMVLPAFRAFTGPFKNPEEGRLFRRVYEVLGLGVIGRAIDLSGGRLSGTQAASQAQAAFTLDFHELQMFKKVLDAHQPQRNGAAELAIGPIADFLGELVEGKPAPAVKAAAFDATKETWDPPRAKEGRA